MTARRNAYVAGFSLLAAMGRAEARDLGLDELRRALRSGRQLRPRAGIRPGIGSDDPAPLDPVDPYR